MTAADAVRRAAARLAPISDTARLDAELLMAHMLGLSREDLILRLRDLEEPDGFAALVERRMRHEPVSHITGRRDFWTLTLAVTPDVLTPRPESETLIEAAVDHYRGGRGPRAILDLGTGSGALLLAALDHWREARGLGIDISAQALAVAHDNAKRCGLEARARFRPGNWCDGIVERFDLVLANPPYIATSASLPPEVADHEPHIALFAGDDGLDACEEIAAGLRHVMEPGALALIEIGFDQGASAAALFGERGFAVRLKRDLAGHPRCLMLRR